jgi:anti-anti-sigma factor
MLARILCGSYKTGIGIATLSGAVPVPPLGGGLSTRFGGICMSTNPASATGRKLTIEQRVSPDGTLTLVCRGRITLETASYFRSEVNNLASEHKFLLADLSAVRSVDSAGLGSIFSTYISAKSRGCELTLVNVRSDINDLLKYHESDLLPQRRKCPILTEN